jgi:hypothetical protein
VSVSTPSLLETVDKQVDAGRTLDQIETDVLAPSPLSEEERAALWLHAWSRRRRNEECGPQRRRRLRGVPNTPPG